MSIISQQLQRTRLGRAESSGSESGLHPVTATRTTSGPIGSGSGRSGLVGERQISSSSIGNGGSGRFTTPIDEEQSEFVFNMDEVDEKKGEKRNSGGWTYAGGMKSPHLGAVGSRNEVSGTTNATGVEGMFGSR
jgi:hypothetical protein